jgi:hypothetical protein
LALILLGLSGALTHDPSAALYIDGKLVAAAEEERFVRDKHAKNRMPYEAAKFCLEFAGIKPAEVDAVAIPFAPISLAEGARWHYAKRYWYAPDRALDALLTGNRRYFRYRKRIEWCLLQLGFNLKTTEIVPVEHHLAHASSAYHCSGFKEKTAILGIDGKGEYATTFFGYGENGRIHKIKEFYDPDSLGGLYGALTEYLGFEMLDGEYKVMGMAPYGDPDRYDFSRLAKFENGELTVNTDYANVIGFRRYKEQGKGYYFSPKLIEWLGPKRAGDSADDPYIHYAASMQKLFEDLSLQMIEHYLGDILRATGRLAFSGGGALNVKLNQKIIARRTSRSYSCSQRRATPGRPSARRATSRCSAACRSKKWRMSFSARRTATKTFLPPVLAIRKNRKGSGCATWRRKLPPCSWPATRWPGSRGVWSSVRVRLVVARSLVARALPALPTGSMRRSSSASAGVRSARACSIRSARRCSAAITRPLS